MIHTETHAPVLPEKVWKAWENAFSLRGTPLTEGSKGTGVIRYKILKVDPGKSYSILWKSLLVKLVYTYTVLASENGSIIQIDAKPKGLSSWIVRLALKKRIQKELDTFLKDFVQNLKYQA